MNATSVEKYARSLLAKQAPLDIFYADDELSLLEHKLSSLQYELSEGPLEGEL